MEERNNIAVSVCVSVHNTAKLLPRCLDSLLKQTLQSLEIVLVNNGSTDNSEDIMHEYEAKYPERKFVIIIQEDRSLSGGRQSGVDNAHGDYITFCDADDYVKPEAYEKMYNAAITNNVDIVEIETLHGDKIMGSPFTGKQDAHEVLRHYFAADSGTIQTVIWLRMYRRELFKKRVFASIYINNEDMFAMPCLMYAAHSIYNIKEQLHFYSVDNADSVMTRVENDPSYASVYYENRKKVLICIEYVQNFIGKENIEKDFMPMFRSYAARFVFSFLSTKFPGISYNQKIKDIKANVPYLKGISIPSFIKHNAFPTTTRMGKLIRLIGLKNTIAIFNKLSR